MLQQLAARWPTDHLTLVLDNAADHKTAAIRQWFAEDADRIAVLWLPTSSPQLNLIERIWRFVKGKLACHRYGQSRPPYGARPLRPLTLPHLTLRHNFS